MGCGCVTNPRWTKKVVGSTDVYSRKHIDRQNDRLDRLHDVHSRALRLLRIRVTELEKIGKGGHSEEE